MTSLIDWAERQLQTVETDGATPACVKLVTAHDGEVWQTWQAPFGDPADWVTEADGYLRSLESEWPNRSVSVCFVALSQHGEVLSKLPKKVTGKNKSLQGGPWNTDQAALSQVMDNLAITMEKFQRLINVQLDSARRTAEVNAETIHQQTELIKLMRQNAATQELESQPDGLTALLKEHSGDFLDLAKLALEQPAAKKASKALNGTLNELANAKGTQH